METDVNHKAKWSAPVPVGLRNRLIHLPPDVHVADVDWSPIDNHKPERTTETCNSQTR